MKIIEKAIAKAVSLYGGDILSKKDVFCILLDDMTPEQVEERQFIKMIYTDDVGSNGVQGVQTKLKRKDRFESK